MNPHKDNRPPRGIDRRYSWRDQSHRQADAGAGAAHLLPITPHPLASGSPAEVVADQRELDDMLEHLAEAGSFAFDSEFIGERSYLPRLCLVQLATRSRVFVIDPLAGWDLSGLWELVVSPHVEKIVLAGQQDMIPTVLKTRRPPVNVLDVQVAAGFVHTEYPLSLARLTEKFVGVPLGKSHQFTHWDKRPLSPVQVRYAGDDVRYLPAAREIIAQQLRELGRVAWAQGECASALGDMSFYDPPPAELYLRVRGRERLNRRQLAVLRELAIVREAAARAEDVPLRTLLKDQILLAMARKPARTLKDLEIIRGLPRPVEAKYGPEFVAAAQKAAALPDSELPPPEFQERSALKDRIDKVFAAVGEFCIERSIAPGLVASRKEVARLVQSAYERRPVDDQHLMQGWRRELLGEMLAKLI